MTTLLVVLVAVPVGIVIGGGLDLGGPGDEAALVADADAATSTSSTSTSTSTSTTVPSTTTTTSTTTASSRPPAQVKLRLSNGSRTAGAAVTIGRRLEALGYRVLAPAPSPAQPAASTTITFRPGFEAEAAALASTLGGAGVKPEVSKTTGPADVVIVVADDVVAPPT